MSTLVSFAQTTAHDLSAAWPGKPTRPGRRVAAACAIFAVNALLLTALTFVGGNAADAQNKLKPAVTALSEEGSATKAAADDPASDNPRAEAKTAKRDAVPAAKDQAPAEQPKLRARKYMPVHHFGGY